MTWAFKRQFFSVFTVVSFFLVFGFLVISPRLSKEPTCFDNKKNGTETGVDCGGSCVRACVAQVDPISIIWARAFQVVPGRYNAVAYLENHNKNIAVNKINYRFRFADGNNVYIGKRDGSTYIPPSGKFVVFEPGIGVGNSIPVYTTFEFTEMPEWSFVAQEKIDQLKVLISDIDLINKETSSTLSATIKNNSFFTIRDLDVVAILYDGNSNAVSASRTYLDKISGGESKEINFTWPVLMLEKVVKKEIIPMYNIFSVKLK